MSFADKLICLCLNKLWIPVDQKTGKEAVSDLFSGNFKAVNIHHNEENEAIMQVLDWDGWRWRIGELSYDDSDLINRFEYWARLPDAEE